MNLKSPWHMSRKHMDPHLISINNTRKHSRRGHVTIELGHVQKAGINLAYVDITTVLVLLDICRLYIDRFVMHPILRIAACSPPPCSPQ